MNALMLRRRALIAAAGGKFELPTYTGAFEISGDEKKGYMKLKGNGTLTLSAGAYDLCLLGAGYNGTAGSSSGGGSGGNGGRVISLLQQAMSGGFACSIGAYNGANSTLDSMSSASGQSTKSTGVCPFGDTAFAKLAVGGGNGAYIEDNSEWGSTFDYSRNGGYYGAGGGRGGGAKVYAYKRGVGEISYSEGGYDGEAGTANTGGGGGGGGYARIVNGGTGSGDKGYGGAGGSGIIIIRWGY